MGPEPELHLLLSNQTLDEPLWKSLFRNIDDFFFPKKLPPLVLTSKPIPVRDIWGFYNYKGRGVAGSTVIHVLALALIIAGTYVGRKIIVNQPKETVVLIAPDDLPRSAGFEDHERRRRWWWRSRQTAGIAGPSAQAVDAADHSAAGRGAQPATETAEVAPTIVVPPDIHLQQPNMPDLGDPLSRLPSVPSNGTGYGGGIGTGSGGGVGSGSGPGYGPGSGGGTGGGVFRVGGGVSAPRKIYDPDPEYSEEARKAKYQGTCVLYVIVGPDGRTRDIRVSRTLGLGLDEKAIEAVKTWRFEPGKKDGKPVSVAVNIEVEFRLY